VSEAIYALLGVLIGSLTTIAVELMKSRSQRDQHRNELVRVACAELTSTLAQIDLYSSAVRDSVRRDAAIQRLGELQVEARAKYETLRLVLDSKETQESGRMALRHAWAMWQQAVTGVDPRAGEYDDDPWHRYHHELRNLLVGVRRELGLRHPEDVFEEPTS
jgi:hypothetical protein